MDFIEETFMPTHYSTKIKVGEHFVNHDIGVRFEFVERFNTIDADAMANVF